jgi:hypothetical protein
MLSLYFYYYQALSVDRNSELMGYPVERHTVNSCNLITLGYNTHLLNLEIEFHSGMVFQ